MCLAVWLHAAESLIVATMLPSIVAEIVSYNGDTQHAFGLGDYIARATAATGAEHVSHLLLGIVVMCLFVVGTNAALWRRLYRVAERRYSL